MTKIIITTLVLCTGMSFAVAENINENKVYNAGLKGGTLGAGVEFSVPVNDQYAVRFNFNGLSYSDTENSDDVEYDGTLELSNIGILGDYYPTTSTFRLTAGAYINNNNFSGTATPTTLTQVDLGDSSYGVNDIGHVDIEVTFQKISPYLGLGWGNDTREKGWGFTFDLGVMYHGTPEADVKAQVNNPLLEQQINNDIEVEKQNLEDELSDFKFFPVVMIGVNYTF